MKIKSHFLFAVFASGALLSACSWDTSIQDAFVIQKDFISCPPKDVDGKLDFIGTQACTIDSISKCEGDEKIFKYAFETKHCFDAFPNCIKDEENGTYSCQSIQCAEGIVICQHDDGSYYCADPSGWSTCGITNDCKGGEQCGDLQKCQPGSSAGEYSCQCPQDYIKNDMDCINPLDPSSCGASLDNLEGIQCGEGESCFAKNVNNVTTYECNCLDGLIKCNGKCINPLYNNEYCGTSDSCDALEACGDDRFCNAGKCECTNQRVLCNGKCLSPGDNATCNVNNNCEYTSCKDNEQCLFSNDTYHCEITRCENDDLLCHINGHNTCIKNDFHHCGECFKDCTLFEDGYRKTIGCVIDKDNISSTTNHYKCEYECETGYEMCDGHCYKTQSDSEHCGKDCKTCPSGDVCQKGECVPNQCDDDKCPILAGAEGKLQCLNIDTLCGRDCMDCTEFDSICGEKKCVSLICKDGEHPVYKNDVVVKCETNTVTSCAPKDMPVASTPVNCQTIIQNSSNLNCDTNGECIADSCDNGYILSADKHECTCPEKTHYVDKNMCKKYITQCPANQHVSEDRKSCVANSKTLCALPELALSSSYSGYVHACTSNLQCLNGKCSCASGNSNCNGTCYNLQTTKTHCGSCNKTCPANSSCKTGKCTCSSGYTMCSNTCVNTKTNSNHCGKCGNKCGSSKTCKNGSCIISCSSQSTCSNCKNNAGKTCTKGGKTGKCKKSSKGNWYCNTQGRSELR